MRNRFSLINKASNIVGIALMLLGFVPVPGFSQVSGVYANVSSNEPRAAFLPEFSASFNGLLGDSLVSVEDTAVNVPAISSTFFADSILACEGEECTTDITTEESEESAPTPETEVAPAQESETTTEPIESPTDLCLDDTSKTDPGVCGCGVPDVDSDEDGLLDCEDAFPQDALNGEKAEGQEIADQDLTESGVDVQSEVNALSEAGGVLVDENNQPIPLTSEEALQTLSVADPYFTDGGVKYCFVPSGTCAASCDVCTVSGTPIQDAINAAPAGMTIYMEEGAEFTESFIINKSITLTADGGNKPVIKSSNGEYIVKIENTDSVSIFDLKFDGQGDSDVIGVWIVNAGDVLLQGNEIVDTAVGVQVDNPGNTTKKVRIYKNTIESQTTGSVGIKVNTIGNGSMFASLNTIQNDQYNVLDNSGKEDFELFFNDWGYVDGGGNYQICSMTGYTISDWTQLYNCALLSNVLNNEAFLDGTLYPDVFDQGLEENGGLCIAEKNDTYAVKLDQGGSGTITLNAGESLGAVGIKSSTSCYYGLAPATIGESVTVNGEDGSACYEVTLYKREDGVYQYYFEKIGSGRGCKDISHMVGYYADPTEEKEEEIDPLQINLECLGEGQFSWKVTNPNNVAVENVQVKVGGNVEFSGSIEANGEKSGQVFSNTLTTLSMEVSWGENGFTSTETDACVEEILNLKLTSMCWEDETTHKFRVRNPNDFDVEYTIHGAGSGGGIAPPGDSFFYITGTYGSANTTIIKWYDHFGNQKQTVKAVNQEYCEEEELEDLELSLLCLGEGQFSWKVSNPNSVAVSGVQVTVNGNIVYTGSLSANAEIGNTLFSGITTSHAMEVSWEGSGFAATETDVCEGGEFEDLQLNLVCLGVGQFAWSVTNPNNFEVTNVQVLIDGSLVFDGSINPNATIGLGVTANGPATHTMVVTWEEQGFASIESNRVCEDTFTPPPQDPPIPVTGTQFLIPVTGLDLTAAPLGLSLVLAAGGSSALALGYALTKRRQDH